MAENKPAIASELVSEFVACAHGDFDRVKERLATEPGLVNACWDWGGGDRETGLGAASHVGHREIALYLLDRGARRPPRSWNSSSRCNGKPSETEDRSGANSTCRT